MTKHAGGRPSKYRAEFIDKIDEYLKSKQDAIFEFHKTRGTTSDSYERKIDVNLPTKEGFAKYIDVVVSTLFEWEKDHKEFSKALGKITAEQKKRLINSGLSGDYNTTIAKLILSSNHNMRDKQDIEHSGQLGINKILDDIDGTNTKE